jgi:putative NIF3 family GTP cyclohydrolase 1 type 2
MILSAFYNYCLKFGIDCDPRRQIKGKAFADSAILHGDPRIEINKIMVGIDMEVSELLLADRIRQRQGLDLVIAHHPEGQALASFYKVMQLQVDLLRKLGVSQKVAQQMLDERMREVERRIIASNHMRSVDAARLLDLPFICVHTPADNQVYYFLNQLIKDKKPKVLQDILDLLMDVPEYVAAAKDSSGPMIIAGNPRRPVGKISLEMTGGTEGPKEALEKLYKAGVRTLVCMHLSEEHFKKVKDTNLNVVIAGHISSDTLGLNLLLDKLERQAKKRFSVTECSGFRRIRHN